MLEAVTRASWLVHAITEPLCNQLVVEKYGCWGNGYGMQPYNLHQYQKYAKSTSDISLLMGQNACALLVCYLNLKQLFRSVHIFVATTVTYYINYNLSISTYLRICIII